MNRKFAIVGCGNISGRHAENICNGGVLKAVCGSLEEMLAILDVVSICIPNGLHAAQATYCVNRGLNMLCEKPLCLEVRDGYECRRKRIIIIIRKSKLRPSYCIHGITKRSSWQSAFY